MQDNFLFSSPSIPRAKPLGAGCSEGLRLRFSFTMKNVHDDAADSLAVLADYLSNGIKTVSAGRRLF